MRAVKIEDEKIKIIIEYDNNRNKLTSCDGIFVNEMSHKQLFFKNPVPYSLISTIAKVEIYLKVSARWKRYLLEARLSEEYENEIVNNISFDIISDNKSEFKTDFSLARC